MDKPLRDISAEAREIRANIRDACLNGEITWQQRDELIALVDADVTMKKTLAKNLLHIWTGNNYDTSGGIAA